MVAVLPVRDENGQAKVVPYGGETRNLITAQSRRRAERTYSRERANAGEGALAGYSTGMRTREWALRTARALHDLGWDPGSDEALRLAKATLEAVGLKFGDKERTKDLTKVLLFAPRDTGEQIAETLAEHRDTATAWLADFETAKAQAAQRTRTTGRARRTTAAQSESESEPAQQDVPVTPLPPLPRELRNQVLAEYCRVRIVDLELRPS